jgi:hypothetical protein
LNGTRMGKMSDSAENFAMNFNDNDEVAAH